MSTEQLELDDADRAFLEGETESPFASSVPASQSKELTVTERAETALKTPVHEVKLKELASKYSDITEIKNLDGRTQCHAAYMVLKNTRVDIEKLSKAARDDATKFSKAVIAEEKRLIDIIRTEENRLQQLRDSWDEECERKRQAEIEAERKRIAGIRSAISMINEEAARMLGKPSAEIEDRLCALKGNPPTEEDFAEFTQEARGIWVDTVAKMEEMYGRTLQQEEEAARLKAEREALAKMRAEQEAKRREEERQAAEARAAAEAELRAERERLAAERERLAQEQAALDAEKRRREEEESAAKAAEEAEAQRILEIERAEEAARLAAEQPLIPPDTAPVFIGIDLATPIVESVVQWPFPPSIVRPSRPCDDDIIAALAERFQVKEITVLEWLVDMDLDTAIKGRAEQVA